MSYKVNKIGFVNFWLYDEEEYYFCDGKLLLRGKNGSGKTVTMQSFFPLIFDGNKSPERLDPFGSRDRKIEDYLLPEGFDGNENTGYLYMEFKNEENKYLTLGMGLKAIKNRQTEFWGFSITDNRRIGTDFLLFKERNLRIPLTKKELQSRLGTGGIFTETIKDYKAMVNKVLFGFQNLDLYTEFINLIIQIRSPKLSNSTKPSQLTKILTSVLEPLSDDDLRIMADSIEDMNKYKEKIDDLKQEQKACKELKKNFDIYNKSLLYEKGDNYLNKRKEYNDIIKTIKENEKQLLERENTINEKNQLLENTLIEKKELIHKKNKLEESDLKNITKELEVIKIDLKEEIESKNKKNNDKEVKEKILSTKQKEAKEKQNEIEKLKYEFKELLKELNNYQNEINFDDSKFYIDDLKEQQFSFTQMPSFINTMNRQIHLLEKLKELAYKVKIKEEEIEKNVSLYDKTNSELKKLDDEHKKISSNLIEILSEYKDKLASYFTNTKALKINDLSDLYKIIDSFNRNVPFKIKEILSNYSYDYSAKYKNNILENKIKINEYMDKIAKIEEELSDIDHIHIKDVDKDLLNYLEKNNISYNYFYELIDFKNIDIDKKKILESFLFDTGILTTLISNANIDKKIKYKSLKNLEKCNNNLTKYIYALDTPYKDKITKIIESISLDNKSIVNLLEDGSYEFALINGQVNSNYELKYIGKETRENYINTLKEKYLTSIEEYNKQIKNKKEIIKELEEKDSLLQVELNECPQIDNYEEYFNTLERIDYNKKLIIDSISSITEEINKYNNDLSAIKEELNENKKGYYGPITYNEITEVLEDTKKYNNYLNSINEIFNTYKNKEELLNSYKISVEEYTNDLDNINYEIHKIEIKIAELNKREKTLNDIMENEYKDAGNEYKKIIERLDKIEDEIPNINKVITECETNNIHTRNEIEKYKNDLNDIEIIKNVLYQIFLDEYNLHYVKEEIINENEIGQILKAIKQTTTSKDALTKLLDSQDFFAILNDYAPKKYTVHEKEYNEYLNYTNDSSKTDIIIKSFKDAERIDLSFNYLGKNVNLYDLACSIDSSINNYSNLVNDEERHLFYDLIMNNIGSSIRNKINQSEIWINDVRKLMESMNISSGLKFSLRWNGIKAEGENEIDTGEIVEIFKKSAERLTENDYKKISEHFKSKINSIEEVLEESERNYLEIIKDVLDYRKWFEFKLFFSRGNGEKKELTDKQFNKMSGGEKAIAMYIPLFSCVYAKLGAAKKDAPRIVALDEAFAGVDDGNMRDAFRILGELDLDFILTSQSIWGDFDTVKNLAISELYHPADSQVVTSINYRWNGIRREKVEDNHEFETV